MKVASQNLSIMLTDIQGYTNASASSSRDQLVQLLRDHNRLMIPLIRFHGGTIIKQIGDALLVTFGSATDAAVCAIMIQLMLREFNRRQRDETRKLQLRVVINTGDVTLQDGDIFGDAVNITARIEGLSCFPGGSIGISESTYLLMNQNEIVAELIGPHQLKGIPNPVNVYRIPLDKQRLTELPSRLLDLVEFVVENQHTNESDFENGMRQIINVDPGIRRSDSGQPAATAGSPAPPTLPPTQPQAQPPAQPPAQTPAQPPVALVLLKQSQAVQPTGPTVSPIHDFPHTEASFGLRFKSLLIDRLVLTLYLFSIMAKAKVTILLLPPLYLTVMWTTRGATVGQLVCRLRVVCSDGQPPDFFTALLRTLFFPVSFLPVLFGKERLLHDILGNTQVFVQNMPPVNQDDSVDASLWRRAGPPNSGKSGP